MPQATVPGPPPTAPITPTFAELLDDCIEYVQFAAFTGDAEMTLLGTKRATVSASWSGSAAISPVRIRPASC